MKKKYLLFLASFLLCIGLLIAGELTLTFLNNKNNQSKIIKVKDINHIINYNNGYEERLEFEKWRSMDKVLGIINHPNQIVRHQLFKREGDSIRYIFDVAYHSDKFGKRKTPIPVENTREAAALFLGGSFAYGDGCNQEETLPFFFSKMSRKLVSYNFGVGATGTNVMLWHLKNRDFKAEVREPVKYIFYVYMTDHIRRSTYVIEGDPFYYMKDSRIHSTGDLKEKNPLSFFERIAKGINKTQFSKIFSKNLVPEINNERVKYTCELIEEAKRVSGRKFPNSKFYVIMHPLGPYHGHETIETYINYMTSCLAEKSISYFEFYDFFKTEYKKYIYEHDRHPNPLGNKTLVKLIIKKLKLKDSSKNP